MGNCVSLQTSCACSCLFGDGKYMHMIEENLEALQKAMQELRERCYDLLTRVVTEEDEGWERLAQVQGWYSRVEDVMYKVNDLLEARSTQPKSSLNFISGSNYGKKVLNKLNDVEELISNGVFEVVTEKITLRKVKKKHIQFTVGLGSKVNEAFDCLFRDGRTTLGLYGMGGIGKTTLLAGINNKFLEEGYSFDFVIWVVVSKDLQYEAIQDQILRRLGLDKDWEQETEEERAVEIYNILNGKKFVLLLDNLWRKVDMNKVGVPPITQQNGSKIVFTTRSDQVCKDMEADDMMEVVRLSSYESWELFKKQLAHSTLKSHLEIPDLARVVAKKCSGLPLALIVTGKSMATQTDVEEWRREIRILAGLSKLLYFRTPEKIIPLLKVSYDSLRDLKVKFCFLYCSLFPEDYEIEKNELIEYWMCEGYIDGNIVGDGDNNYGHDIINLLVSANLLMDVGVTTKVKMHDVVRELALSKTDSGVWLREIPTDTSAKDVKKMSLMKNHIAEISCSPKCPKLWTLLLGDNKLVDISGEFFRYMPALVFLDLSKNKRLTELPEEISNLVSLRQLNLSHTGIKSLAVVMKKLRNLTYLNLEFTSRLENIGGISRSLRNLQVLKFFKSGVCINDRLMEELQLLKHLKYLTANIEDAVILEGIQRVEGLVSSIRGLCLRKMLASVVILNTVALGGLQSLEIVNCKISEIEMDWEGKERREVLPQTSSASFKYLSSVKISDLEGPKDLTWLVVFAQNLTYLSVMRSSSIEEIINSEKGISISEAHPRFFVPLREVEHLEVSGMDELKRICENPRALPKLRQFIVRNCPKLPLSLRDRRKNRDLEGSE